MLFCSSNPPRAWNFYFRFREAYGKTFLVKVASIINAVIWYYSNFSVSPITKKLIFGKIRHSKSSGVLSIFLAMSAQNSRVSLKIYHFHLLKSYYGSFWSLSYKENQFLTHLSYIFLHCHFWYRLYQLLTFYGICTLRAVSQFLCNYIIVRIVYYNYMLSA